MIEDPSLERYEDIQWLDENTTLPTHEEFEREQKFKTVREIRNRLISFTDNFAISDWPHSSPEKRQEWLDYRQALRDLPANTEDPENVNWPIRPDMAKRQPVKRPEPAVESNQGLHEQIDKPRDNNLH
jgi:hypothetical protein